MMAEEKYGFAKLTPEERAEIANIGGKAAHELKRAHRFTSDEARIAGKKGGIKVSQDRKHMAEIGRKGARERHKKAGHDVV